MSSVLNPELRHSVSK